MSRNHAGTAKTALAMDDHVKAIAQARPQALAYGQPSLFESIAGNRNVGNGQVKPVHVLPADFVANVRYAELTQFVRLDKGNHYRRAAIANGSYIENEVAVPNAGCGLRLLLAPGKRSCRSAPQAIRP